jgi:regulator of nucleoside diphosphate kinase
MIVSSVDLRKLRALLSSRCEQDDTRTAAIEAQLAHATVVEAERLPRNVVTIDSAVVMRDVESGAHHYLLLLLHPQSKRSRADVSVLEPKGLALLGRRVGEVIAWPRSNGMRRMRIESVQQPAGIRAEGAPIATGGFAYA